MKGSPDVTENQKIEQQEMLEILKTQFEKFLEEQQITINKRMDKLESGLKERIDKIESRAKSDNLLEKSNNVAIIKPEQGKKCQLKVGRFRNLSTQA